MATIVIVDDHPATRDGLRMRIEIESDLEMCGEAGDVETGFELIQAQQPDLAVIDVSLKSGSGLELIKRVKSANLATRMLVWSMYEDSLYAERALRAGAMGYVNKENATGRIVEAMRSVLSGAVFLDESASAKMLNRIVLGKNVAGTAPDEALSDRELQTFELIGRGMNTTNIAENMRLSPKTVETYRARIKEKLELNDMASLTREAVQWVIENG